MAGKRKRPRRKAKKSRGFLVKNGRWQWLNVLIVLLAMLAGWGLLNAAGNPDQR
ncbi:hypothetical protein [Lactiplantibacillus carotarum]|uniref:hypothetical protein n=1 Tax=Lactiplantibacillus carotarum TaxID=2993456 RepID=UPI00298EDD1C|nr:hypothetical protein [Lactiplantibacillus carotarum]